MAAVLLGLALAGCTGDNGDKTTDATGDTGDTDTAPTTGVDYGMAPMSAVEHVRLTPAEDRKTPEREDAQ